MVWWGGCFTDVKLYSSEIYHQVHTTEPCRLPKDVAPAWGAVSLLPYRFQFVQVGIYGRMFVVEKSENLPRLKRAG